VRPLLGTLVEIGVWGGAGAAAAIESAFEAVSQVQRLMSVHDPDSDVSLLNREAAARPVPVHAWTADVLRFALRMWQESGGAFDCGIGSSLESAGFLPPGAIPGELSAGAGGMRIDDSNQVRMRQPACLDLGGIAKGYAVDRAIEALQGAGVASGIVNAGGDLRGFGLDAFPVTVRDPDSPGRFVRVLRLNAGAVATSAGYHSARRVGGRSVMPIYDPLRRRFLSSRLSVTVTAPTCMAADALTKVAAILGADSFELLRRHGAHAMWWRRGSISTTWETVCTRAA